MRFIVIVACQCGVRLLPTQPRGYAVIAAFSTEQLNFRNQTFTYVYSISIGVPKLRLSQCGQPLGSQSIVGTNNPSLEKVIFLPRLIHAVSYIDYKDV